ncbi:MAG: hypothetical protein Q8O62_11380 [Aequorivita sp.]|nr:hypothetical protein [Aequorivita sp.]
MNFNYSYRAFLITSLLTGILVLLLYSIKLSGDIVETNEETYDVVMAPEELLPEDLAIAELTPEIVKVETNRAYNEAEKFISSVENEDQEITETTEGKLQEMNEAIENSKNENGNGTSIVTKPKENKKKKFSNSEAGKEGEAVVKSGNRNTTISYQLVNRKDIDLPNPVYTCFGFGKVVINIEVNNLGKVVKNSYNKTSSTTSNECLIDAALEYSAIARFNTDASKTKQLGTITFNFPGQQ